MKVIFLDIDGVLNTERYCKIQVKRAMADSYEANFNFDPICMRCLKELIDKTGAKIVLSSSWRENPKDEYFYQFQLNLKVYGLLDSFISTTPIFHSSDIRGEEIKLWLNINKNIYKDIEYIIIDDEDNMGELKDRLVKCNPYYGFNNEMKEKAYSLFNIK